MQIASGTLVRIHYQLFDEEGELFESSAGVEPAEFIQGNGEIPIGLEKALEGKKDGEKLRIELEGTDAFGPYLPEGLISVPRSELPEEVNKGDMVPVVLTDDDGADVDDGDMEFRVIEIRPEEVVLDANHPLAGQKVTFDVEIVAVDGH